MSVVLVTGGSGTLGTHVVRLLGERGHEVRVLSRRPEAGTHVGDLSTGAGVAEAVAGADVVVHAASDTRHSGKGDLTQTEQLLAASRDAGHLIYVSIVGIDLIPLPYYKRKLACEQAIVDSGIPHTIVRATQFHELLAFVLEKAERSPIAPLPLDLRVQSIAAAEAAEQVAALVDGPPLGRAPDVGGPEVLTTRAALDAWREARGRPRRVIGLRLPGRIAAGFREGRNTCPDRAVGRQTWREFLAASRPT